ncbi:MAG: glycerol-3-phosphate dehydrogenase/oxidase [Chitinophagaceae bacterium]|nr:glycerol-3-phosphate dehydrogenase/oxidase [Chitinophagaceae bacterium]
MNRRVMIQQMENTPLWDVCIIGGGATGLSIALDASSRGWKTLLLEKHDLAHGTSSRSTKLIHGGVRYLQQGRIRMVTDALKERGRLRQNAPGLVRPLPFVIPVYARWQKPFYLAGLKLYDVLAGSLRFGMAQALSQLETLKLIPTLSSRNLHGGVLYYDGQFDDARLAIAIARKATQCGAVVLNYFPVQGLLKQNGKLCGVWAKDRTTGREYEIQSKAVINATGVFADQVMKMDNPFHSPVLQPSQGIHLVADRDVLPGHAALVIPRTDDGRVLFAIPWHEKVLLGTTDTPMTDVAEEPVPLREEAEFILSHIGRYLSKKPSAENIKSIFAGLRPLVKKGQMKTSRLSRDHYIFLSESGLFTITGGKWTTCRKMAQDMSDKVAATVRLPEQKCITDTLLLCDETLRHPPADIASLRSEELKEWIEYTAEQEMCVTPEDFLSRRTRQLQLDARAALHLCGEVANRMAQHFGYDEKWVQEQIQHFSRLAECYLPEKYLN